MFQCSTFTLFVGRDEKSSERVVARQASLQLTDKCFCSFPRGVCCVHVGKVGLYSKFHSQYHAKCELIKRGDVITV